MKAIWAENTPYSKFLISVGVILLSAVAFTFISVAIATTMFGISMTEMETMMSDLSSPESLNLMRIVQTLSSIGTFVVPPFILAYLFDGHVAKYLSLDKKSKFASYLLVIGVMILATPFINFLGELNSHMHLPSSMKFIEDWMRASEDKAAKITEEFMKMHSWKALLFNLFMVALIPALGEELVFRGIVQKIFSQWLKNKHVGIWLSAFLFSAMHMQFYGFLPRMILGGMLGYLLVWSGSLWLPILAHFVNNAGAVIFTYMYSHGQTTMDPDKIGAENDYVSVAVSVAVIVIIFAIIYRNESQNRLQEG